MSSPKDARLFFLKLLHGCNPDHGFRYAHGATALPLKLLTIRDVIGAMLNDIERDVHARPR